MRDQQTIIQNLSHLSDQLLLGADVSEKEACFIAMCEKMNWEKQFAMGVARGLFAEDSLVFAWLDEKLGTGLSLWINNEKVATFYHLKSEEEGFHNAGINKLLKLVENNKPKDN